MSAVAGCHRVPGPRLLTRYVAAAAVLTGVAAVLLDLVVAPVDAVQGEAQRLMYVHVPSAWTAYLAFGVVGVASAGALLSRHAARWSALARAAAELGVCMTALTLVEGSLWGHSAWGTWWTWDPRLVSTAILLVVYAAYLLLHLLHAGSPAGLRRVSVLGIVALVQVPVVHFSVLWWRSLHQPPTILRPDLPPPIAASLLVPLLVSLLAFTCAGVWFLSARTSRLLSAASAELPVGTAAADPPGVRPRELV